MSKVAEESEERNINVELILRKVQLKIGETSLICICIEFVVKIPSIYILKALIRTSITDLTRLKG